MSAMNLASLAEQNLAEFGVYERLLFEGRSYTNLELHEMSCRLAGALVALGCRPGDKVILMMPNAPEVFVAYAALWRAGLIVIPVLFVLDAREVEYILADSGAKVVITSQEVAPKIEEVAGDVRVVVAGEGALPPGWFSFDDLAKKNARLDSVVPRQAHDPATILYTSGTTGRPKGVIQTHENLRANARNTWDSAAIKRLPKSTIGKILKKEIRKVAAARFAGAAGKKH